jgi:hypothetical protein
MSLNFKIQYTDRLGRTHVAECKDVKSALERLANIDAIEAETRKCAPSDSGDVRFNYLAEAKAIRAAIFIA